MSYDSGIYSAPMVFGTATSVASPSTNTSIAYPMPRADYTVQVTVIATGTSGVGAAVIWQGSDDNLAWLSISSATATATQAGTGTTYVGAAMIISATRFAYGRASSVVVTGTGAATVFVGH